ncbi:MAG: penicillin-binding protein activator LpoB, partial [Salibacteraceae bacterium]
MKTLVKTLAIISIAFFIDACASRKVTRVDPNTQMDISGRWNDTDSKQVAENMTADVLSKPWLNRFTEAHDGKRPVVIIGDVLNKSHEHISSETFTKDIERAFINSGKVRVVESSALREKIRTELESQQGNATEATKKELAKELGADFMMFG